MKKAVLLLSFTMILILAIGNATCASYMKVMDFPPVNVEENGATTFNITLQNLGSDGSYAKLLFRNVTSGISISTDDTFKYIYQGGKLSFPVTLSVTGIAPGNYSAEVGVSAKGSSLNFKEFYIVISPKNHMDLPDNAENISNESEHIDMAAQEGDANALNDVLSNQTEQVAQSESQTENETSDEKETESTPGFSFPIAFAVMMLVSKRVFKF